MRAALLTLLLFVSVAGCESTVNVDLEPYPPQLVVTSFLTSQEPWRVRVQRTASLGVRVPDFPLGIATATVTIEGDDGTVAELVHRGGGFYHAAEPNPIHGVVYRLHVHAEGFEAVYAVDAMPAHPSIASFTTTTGVIEIGLQDVGGVRNYYEILVLSDEQLVPLPFTVLNPELEDQIRSLQPGDLFDPTVASPAVTRALLHDGPFDGLEIMLRLEASFPGPVTVYTRSISEAYFRYRRSLQLQRATEGNPFVEPVIIHSNVRGGHGVFAGFSTHTVGANPPNEVLRRITGTYRLLAFEVAGSGQTVDHALLGASAVLTLHSDFTATGTLQFPDRSGPTFSLDGGFSLEGGVVRLFHDSDTALRDMPLFFDARLGTLSGTLSATRGERIYVQMGRR